MLSAAAQSPLPVASNSACTSWRFFVSISCVIRISPVRKGQVTPGRLLPGTSMSHRPLSRGFVLEQRPVGQPRASDFRLVASEVPELRDGEFSLANLFLSMDPAIRGFLDDRK